MSNLARAHQELFRRSPDERFSALSELREHCQQESQFSSDCWHLPQSLEPSAVDDCVTVRLGDDGAFLMNDWSFSQLCRLSGVTRGTLNRLSPETTSLALQETLPTSDKPFQFLATGKTIRSMHGVVYTRLWNADLLDVVSEFATNFQPPPAGAGGATGLYCGEQDLFAFLIDPAGWAEINGEAFAPGFFVWNSEVGRRSLGIQTFWFQAICQNHIVWDAVEVVEFSRKHTRNVHDGLDEIRRIIEALAEKRDARRDSFVRVVSKAMQETLGADAESVAKELGRHGIPRNLGQQAIEIARQQGRFTIFALVDALTRLTQKSKYVGERTEADQRVAGLLALAA